MTCELCPVESSNIEAIGFDPEAGELHVRFKGGKTFCYSGCTQAEHDALLQASSIGKHFHQHLRGKKEFRAL